MKENYTIAEEGALSMFIIMDNCFYMQGKPAQIIAMLQDLQYHFSTVKEMITYYHNKQQMYPIDCGYGPNII